MERFIGEEGNLRVIMNLLREKSKNIQFEAFHVFKVSFSIRFDSIFGFDYYSEWVERGMIADEAMDRFSWRIQTSYHRLR